MTQIDSNCEIKTFVPLSFAFNRQKFFLSQRLKLCVVRQLYQVYLKDLKDGMQNTEMNFS